MKKIIFALIILMTVPIAHADEIYQVESASNDQYLIINGTNFAAKSYCHDYQFGDEVVFLDGDPNGSCTEALILNLRTNQACSTWCESPY